MGLDYTNGCVNFRDVGEWVNCIAGRMLLREKTLLRGGKIDFVRSASEVGFPRTIVNLRRGADAVDLGATCVLHFPISNDHEKYETEDRVVRRWLRDVVSAFAHPELEYPVLIHCTSGKDRTGVVVAALLAVLEVPEDVIVQEYLLSDGEVRAEWIRRALAGVGDPRVYFGGLDLDAVRSRLRIP